MSFKSLLFLGLVAARAAADGPYYGPNTCVGDADTSKCPEDQRPSADRQDYQPVGVDYCVAVSGSIFGTQTPDCGDWDMKRMCDPDSPDTDDNIGCVANVDLGFLGDVTFQGYWCCDPEAEKAFWDGIGKAVGTALLWLGIGIVLCCIAICRCCYRRRARMAQTATAHAFHEPLIMVEPEMMASGVEIQATATQVNPKGESL